MVIRDRALRGHRNSQTNFTPELVREMRMAYANDGGMTYLKMADRFGVNKNSIASIMQGRSWMHEEYIPEGWHPGIGHERTGKGKK
jgi:hypothetical protein